MITANIDCPRCGKVHEVEFLELKNQSQHTHWAMCKEFGEPILASDKEQTSLPPEPTEADKIVSDACSVLTCQPSEIPEVVRRHAALASSALEFANGFKREANRHPGQRVDASPKEAKDRRFGDQSRLDRPRDGEVWGVPQEAFDPRRQG